jgi:uncharacterized membrane protein HdeD (DUF308 family)
MWHAWPVSVLRFIGFCVGTPLRRNNLGMPILAEDLRGRQPRVNNPKERTIMATIAGQPQESNIWWLYLLQGIAAILLGLMLFTAPGATLVTLVTFLGFYWLITGVLELVRMFVDRSVPWIWSLLIGIVGVLAGVFVLRHPLLAALTVPTALVIILGVQGLAIGVFEIIGALKGGGVGSFMLGVINLLIGFLLLSSPAAAALAVPFVFGVLLLIQGAGLIYLAFHVHGSDTETTVHQIGRR